MGKERREWVVKVTNTKLDQLTTSDTEAGKTEELNVIFNFTALWSLWFRDVPSLCCPLVSHSDKSLCHSPVIEHVIKRSTI